MEVYVRARARALSQDEAGRGEGGEDLPTCDTDSNHVSYAGCWNNPRTIYVSVEYRNVR